MNFSRQADGSESPVVSVIVPARNEEDCIGDCLKSLQSQQDVPFELMVVDDGSSDATRQIALDLGAIVIDPDPLPAGWSGKSSAIVSAARKAKGKWFLFTDADTIHSPGSLRAALAEAEETGAALLSYSPRQIVTGFWQRALMPVIFAELAARFRPRDVCDPQKPAAAANGQYILMRADVYREVGGHAAVATTLLEDVALARLVKSKGYRLRFRMSDSVSARMYRDTKSMWEGWTKNLAVLFSRSLFLSFLRLLEFSVIAVTGLGTIVFVLRRHLVISAVGLLLFGVIYAAFFARISRAHFGGVNNLLAIFGLPIFSLLLLRSYIHYRVRHMVAWKGRSYSVPDATQAGAVESFGEGPASIAGTSKVLGDGK